jgi:hypothetical protein
LLLLSVSGCLSQPISLSHWQTAYYDRDNDGVVDYELHDIPAASDDAWALVDSDFEGNYDLKIAYGYAIERSPVSKRVPRGVAITRGNPPYAPFQ